MKLVVSLIAGVLLTMTVGHANAQPVDCEAARCTVQATIDAECPCALAKNHGRHTSCVARVVNRLAREGTLPKKCRNKVNACAIRSTCGKKAGSVACDFPGDGVSGRCRPLSSEAKCTARGGTVVASCCESCGPAPTATPEEPIATATPEVPVATATPGGPVATATEGPVATATPEEPVATATESPIPTATPEEPVATPTDGGPIATATPEEPVATATPEATATVEGPVETATPQPSPTSTPAGPTCGNGTLDTGEDCDPPGASSCPNAGNGLEVCSLECTCNCPTRITFAGDAADPLSVLDTGWTGIAHRAPIIDNGDVTVSVDCPAGGRPCGVCALTGPIVNPLPNQLQNQRCSNDTSVICTEDGQCSGGTCEFFFGSNLPLAAGGVTTCVVNQFNGPLSGSVNIETGDTVTTALLTSRVYNGLAIDNPCPRCVGDAAENDGAQGGTCDGGPRADLNCDAGGTIPGRPDFGTTSLDCPPNAAAIIATLPIDLSSATSTVTKSLTADSPSCTDSAGDKCLCDTCNSAAAQPCDSNADCPFDPPGPIGPICGGRRCLGGANVGQACTAHTECPGVVQGCGRPGAATRPSGCQDDTTVDERDMECSDSDGNNLGECTAGPADQNCTVASGHAQRGCTSDGDCGGAPGSCESKPRNCFLTGGGTFQPTGQSDGTDTLTAVGAADPPVNDVSQPTLAAVFCIAPTGLAAVNNVAGLPGPARVTLRGTALGLP